MNGRPVYLSPFHAQPIPAPTERGKPSLDSDFSTPVVDHRGSEFVIVYCKHVTLEDVIPPKLFEFYFENSAFLQCSAPHFGNSLSLSLAITSSFSEKLETHTHKVV